MSMNPGLIRAVTIPDLRRPLRAAIEALATATKENADLRKQVAERDEHILELQQMLERVLA